LSVETERTTLLYAEVRDALVSVLEDDGFEVRGPRAWMEPGDLQVGSVSLDEMVGVVVRLIGEHRK
jgi:hypothetical protein